MNTAVFGRERVYRPNQLSLEDLKTFPMVVTVHLYSESFTSVILSVSGERFTFLWKGNMHEACLSDWGITPLPNGQWHQNAWFENHQP